MAQTSIGAAKNAAARAGLNLDEYLRLRAAGLKRCRICQSWKPITMYARDRSRSDGAKSKCFECDRVKVRVDTRGRPSTFRGRSHTPEVRARLSEQRRGQPGPMAGRHHSEESRRKMSATKRETYPRGSACHAFKDGKLVERRGLRFSADYKRWRSDVFARDGFTCQRCGDGRGGNLHAHHIKPFADYPDLRLEITNGLTLCEPCHKAVHTP